MSDQKQHAKITPEICRLRDRLDASKTVREKTQRLADALRDARLDEALTHWNPLIPHRENTTDHCAACKRIAALERGEV